MINSRNLLRNKPVISRVNCLIGDLQSITLLCLNVYLNFAESKNYWHRLSRVSTEDATSGEDAGNQLYRIQD
jgi:hypothetical protein